MELVIGNFIALAYGPLSDAPGVHAELKKRGIDAAVVDHAYVLSKLQLATALARVDPLGSVSASTISSSKQRTAGRLQEQTARLVFVALARTRSLDRVLQVLPPGTGTASVLVIVRRTTATSQVLATVREVCAARVASSDMDTTGGVPCPSSSSSLSAEEAEARVYYAMAARGDARKVMAFYGVTEADLRAVKAGFSSQDIAALEAMARRCGSSGGEGGIDPKLLINVRALELCVVNKLATADL